MKRRTCYPPGVFTKCPVCGKYHRVRRFYNNEIEVVVCPKLKREN